MCWRLVRPNSPTDVGPLHADAWFWDLGHGITPPGYKRVKVWIAITVLQAKTDSSLCEFSQAPMAISWRVKRWNNKTKIGISEKDLNVEIFNSQPGEAIVFNDQLLHGGVVGQSETRVSLEFTIFVKNENYYN